MQISVKTTNFTMTEALAVFLEQRIHHIEKFLQRLDEAQGRVRHGYAKDMLLVRVELGRSTRHHHKGDVYRAEFTLSVPGRQTIRAEVTAEDLRVAIDRMRDEVLEEVRSWKGKKRTLARKGGREMKRRIHKI